MTAYKVMQDPFTTIVAVFFKLFWSQVIVRSNHPAILLDNNSQLRHCRDLDTTMSGVGHCLKSIQHALDLLCLPDWICLIKVDLDCIAS